MSAILHNIEHLLIESSRPGVRRIGIVASRSAVRGLCLEMGDGTRFGECPINLSDIGLKAAGVRSATPTSCSVGKSVHDKVSMHSCRQEGWASRPRTSMFQMRSRMFSVFLHLGSLLPTGSRPHLREAA